MKSSVCVTVVALLLLALIRVSVQQSDGICYQSVARYVPQRRYRAESFVSQYYIRCGWFGWDRCVIYRTSLRRVPFYVSVMTYNLRSFCCTGYLGNANDPEANPRCIAQCTQGCFNGGYCGAPETCICNNGWGGIDCTEDINECNDPVTCTENQVCFNKAGSYLCECDLGYERDPDSGTTSPGVYQGCKDIDECIGFHGCSYMCQNLNGTYRCLCDTGYIIQADERQCQDVNECLDNNGGCSDNCTNTDGSYYCSCFSGFELSSDNHTCEDIKECINGTNEICEERCIELEGGFRCGCKDGYRLRSDNVSCEEVNECEEGISGCQQLCNNSNGSYHCDCYSGYHLKEDRHMCEDDNECEVNNGGCSQNCTNTPGSYECSCEEGYSLNFDGFNCSGQSCLSLMTPRNGNYTCDGAQITGTVCTFECNLGYNLVGSERRECLRNNKWSGNPTSCKILHCEELDGSENSDVVLPCNTKLRSTCRVDCSSGFYTNLTNPFQECQVTPNNVAIWSEPPQCIARELCFPNPCEHNGICSITEEDTFTCDCDGTGYTGEMCDVLLINTPDISGLRINSPMNFSLFAQPDRTFVLELVPDDKSAIIIMPSSVMFSKVLTQHKISMTAKIPGFYKLQYRVKDDSVNYQPIPPATILVSENDTGISYCESRNITCGLIQPGCCSANESQLNLEFKCPSSDSELLLRSTCGWVIKGTLHSAGVIFSSIDGFDMPVAIAGAQIFPQTSHIDLQGLTTFEFNHGCVACTRSTNCQIERLSVNLVQDFLEYDSLAFTYLHQSMELIPSWLMMKVLPSGRIHDFRSYLVYLVYSDALNRVQECSGLTALTGGLYSILVYTGNLEVMLDEETRQYTSNGSMVCFATNLCEGSRSPLYVSISGDAHKVLDSFGFMDDLRSKGWNILINNIILSDTNAIPTFDEVSQLSYWNGIDFISPNLQNPNMITKLEFTKSFSGDSGVEAKWNFIGNVQWFHEDFNDIFRKDMNYSWDGYLNGTTELNINVTIYGAISTLKLLNDTSPSLLLASDIHDGFRCHGCPNPKGFALKLVYQLVGFYTGLFSVMLAVPPENLYGLRTQFSCPLDAFMFLNNDHDLEAVSIVSSCLDVNLRFFPIIHLQTNIYMFDECKIGPFCAILSSDDANLIVWSKFPESISELNLGHFLKLLPVSNSNRTGLVATFSRNTEQLKARLFNVKASLFDTTFNSMATIDNSELRFTKVINLYNRYPTEMMGSIEQTSDWNSASLDIFGNFEKTSSNVPELLCNQIEAYTEILYKRSQFRIQNAEIVFNRTKSQFAAAEMTHMEREIAKNESSNQILQAQRELMRINGIIQSISSELENANNEVTSLMNQINELCITMECPEICIPRRVCEDCMRDVGTLIQGTCTFSCTRTETVTEITGGRYEYRWEYLPVQQCYYACYCIRRGWSFRCYARFKCSTVYICSLVAFYTPIVEQVTREVPSVCNEPCSAVGVRAPIMAQCCANVGCSRREQDTNCLRQNQLCENTRNAVYENLAEEQRNATVILQSLDEARANQRAVLLRLMRYEANYNFTERQFNESLQALDGARAALDIATSSFDRIKRETKLDLLENIQNVGVCRLPSSYFELRSVSFTATIVTESPTILPLDITMFFPSSNRTVTETVNLDFYRFNMSLQQAAVIVTNLILNQRLSKRHTRNAVNISTEDENYLHFQSRCTDIENILSYFRELNNSIFTVAETVISSMAKLDENMREISNLIDSSVANLTQEANVDAQKIADITNKDVADIRTVNNANRSKEVIELLNLMQEHLSNGEKLTKSLDNNLFQSWQVKMEDLHNQTGSAAGFSCFGFSDCLQEIVDTLNELVNDIPSSNAALLSALPAADKDLQDLALLENYSIISAVKNTLRIYGIANDSVLRDYWCAGPPKIITQPVMNITPIENTTIELSCKVEIEQFTTYQWRKDCVQLPDQRNSTLVLSNVRLSDSGNYTCVVTNQASSTISINASVEVHQFPAFFLEPDNADVYLGDSNGATFQSNATGFPFPGFRWYFQPKGREGFTQIPDEDENELVIPTPQPKDEGSYYCEAFNKQGFVRSRIVNLTVLDPSVLQVAQTVYINFTRTGDLEDLNDDYDQSGSGFTALTSTTTMRLRDNLVKTLKAMISFNSTSLENVTISSSSIINITISFTLYSKYIDYPETPLSEIIQLAPLAREEWGAVWERLQLLLGSSELFITDDEGNEYISNPSSVTTDVLQDACPAGKTVSTINNLLCVSCPPGSYQIPVLQRMVDDDGRVLQQITPECVRCSIGYYQDEQGRTTCKQCPVGYTTDTTGVRFKSNCIKLCSPGNFSENGKEPCKPCPSGMYSIGMGSKSCFNCNDEENRNLCPFFVDPCEKCQHLCLNNSNCACHDGYTLSSDGYSCIKCAKVFIDYNGRAGLTVIKPTWHVALCNTSDTSDPLVCSGSLINDQWAITSARCVCGHNIDINSLSLRVNKLHTCVVEENNEIDIFASAIYCHPGYNNSDDDLTDLALIRMSSRIQKEELNNTLPLCIQNSEVHSFRSLIAYGLGNPTQMVIHRAVLSPAFVSVSSKSGCFEEFLKEGIDYKNNTNVFCTDANSNGKCVGNPGSAVFSFDNKSGKITFVGVISRFTKVCGKFQSHTANIQIQNSDILQWIDNTIAENN